jgi:ribonuclease Z
MNGGSLVSVNHTAHVPDYLSLLFCGLALSGLGTGVSAQISPGPEVLRLTLLGTGNPRPTIDRFGPSTLIEAGSHRLLIDAGRGATIRLAQLGVSSADIDAVLLTHLHSDHVVGLPDLWLTGWIFNRRTGLVLVGPEGVRSMADALTHAYAFDIHTRRDLDEHLSPNGVLLPAREIEEGTAYETSDGLLISAFLVDHGPTRPALGYRVDFHGRSAVLSGDTRPSQNLVRRSRGVDVLVHEVISVEAEHRLSLMGNPAATERVIERHTTVPQAADIFQAVRPRLAVYSHIVPSPVTEQELTAETRIRYDGPLAVGYDLMQITIGEHIEVVDKRPAARTVDH